MANVCISCVYFKSSSFLPEANCRSLRMHAIYLAQSSGESSAYTMRHNVAFYVLSRSKYANLHNEQNTLSSRQNLKNSQPSNRNVCGLYYYITFRYPSSKCLNKYQRHINIVVSIFLSLVLLVADRRGPLTHWLPEARRDPKNGCGHWGVTLVAWFDLCHLSCRLPLLYRL